MNKFFTMILAISAIGFASSAQAEEKIATVDVAAVVQKSVASKSVYAQAGKMRTALQTEATAKEKDLRAEEKDLLKQRSVISKESFEKRTKEFKKKMVIAQNDLQAKGAKLQAAGDKAMSIIKVKIFAIVKELAKKNNYTLVLPSANLLYLQANSDITADVIKELNTQLTDVKLKK